MTCGGLIRAPTNGRGWAEAALSAAIARAFQPYLTVVVAPLTGPWDHLPPETRPEDAVMPRIGSIRAVTSGCMVALALTLTGIGERSAIYGGSIPRRTSGPGWAGATPYR